MRKNLGEERSPKSIILQSLQSDRATKTAKPNPEKTSTRNLGLEALWSRHLNTWKQRKAMGCLKARE